MHPLPTLYKARHLSTKRPVCAICLDRTRGRTQEVRLAYRVTVWLCPGHADPAFQRKRGGRDFVRTLMGAWQAHGCLTQARHRALEPISTSSEPTRHAHDRAATPGPSCDAAWKRTTPPAPHPQTPPPATPATPAPPTPPTAAPSSAGTPNGAGSTARPSPGWSVAPS